jgi:hypothetical protein
MLKHSLSALVGLLIVECSSAQNTRGQDAMWVAYQQCRSDGRVPTNVQLIRVDPNGHGWYQTYSSSYGGADFEHCINEKVGAKTTTQVEPAPPMLGP